MDNRKPFQKPPLTLEDQVSLLKDRGLLIDNDDDAVRLLSNVNYYHLEGYWYPFYDKEKEAHVFYENIHLDQIISHYEFDRELKSIVFSGISRIEVAFRTQFAYWIAMEYGAFPFKKENFNFRSESEWAKSYQRLVGDVDQSKEEFVAHFKEIYKEELPPIWMMVELMSLGELSVWYDKHLKESLKKKIAKHFGVSEKIFTSWIRTIALVRNTCAHQARLWNRIFTISLMTPQKLEDQKYTELFAAADENASHKRLYNILLIIAYLLAKIDETEQSCSILKEIDKLIKRHYINSKRIGIPESVSLDTIEIKFH